MDSTYIGFTVMMMFSLLVTMLAAVPLTILLIMDRTNPTQATPPEGLADALDGGMGYAA